MALGAVTLMAGSAMATISGSSHDLSGVASVNNPNGELCIYCHTPHNANASLPPLWWHTNSAAAYTPYGGSGTLDATVAAPAAGSVSLACLSCHDGTVALDAFGGMAGTLGTIGGGATNLGTDLSNDHPIAFTFDAALAGTDGELYDPTTQASGLGSTVALDMLFGAGNDQLECASCHDVHNQASNPNMLLKTNGGSALCLTCHNK